MVYDPEVHDKETEKAAQCEGLTGSNQLRFVELAGLANAWPTPQA